MPDGIVLSELASAYIRRKKWEAALMMGGMWGAGSETIDDQRPTRAGYREVPANEFLRIVRSP